jgi:NPCBM/NEW2 domain-containing protein
LLLSHLWIVWEGELRFGVPPSCKSGANWKLKTWQVLSSFVAYPSADLAHPPLRTLPSLHRLLPKLGAWVIAVALSSPAQAAQTHPGKDFAVTNPDPNRPIVELITLNNFSLQAPQSVRLLGWKLGLPLLDPAQAAQEWMQIRFQPAVRGLKTPKISSTSGGSRLESGWQLELIDGGRLLGRPGGGDADQIHWNLGQGSQLHLLPIDLLAVRGFTRGRLPETDQLEQDLLVLRTASGGMDRRYGWLESVGADGLSFAEGDLATHFDWERIHAVRLLEEPPEVMPDRATTLMVLHDGSYLALRPERIDKGMLIAGTSWGATYSLPLSWMERLDRLGGPFLDLRSLPDREQSFPAARILDWRPRLDRTIEGRRMHTAQVLQPYGYGVKAPSRLSWALSGSGIFTAWVGVDDEVSGHRDPSPLVFRILVDGREIADSGPIAYGSPVRAMRVNLPATGKLELVCESVGGKLAGGGHGSWIMPRIWSADKAKSAVKNTN